LGDNLFVPLRSASAFLATLLTAFTCAQTPFTFQVESGRGLTVMAGGVPVIRGSWFQYYEAGWSKGYYSSNNADQKVEKLGPESYRVSYDDGSARGVQTFQADGNHLKVHYEFDWDGDHPVRIETSAGMIWAPAFENGALTAAGQPTRPLNSFTYNGPDLVARRFSADASDYQLQAPLGSVTEHSSVPLTLFDARGGYNQDWAQGHQLWWLGALGLVVEKDKPAILDVDWTFNPAPTPESAPVVANLKTAHDDAVLKPDTQLPILIPKPKTVNLDWDHPLQLTGAFSFPAGVFDHLDEFKAALSRRFVMPMVEAKTPKVEMDAGVSKLGYVHGGYRITIRPDGMSVLGEEDEGLRFGLERLAALAFVKDGKLWVPTGLVDDQPQADWRGVHLFVGPSALPFQERLWTNVLRPLGFNKVVLQCERTAWDATPGIQTAMTMPKPELVRLFEMYRNLGVDPIPLIESFGHMEWLFANGKNLDVAMNPKVPYAVDPRKPGTQALLGKIWDEAIDALHPDIIHFGLDEVNMRGFPPDPDLTTQLWTTQLGFLGGIARSHNVQMMLWGDQGLAPGEAPDAALAEDKANAAARRAAVPKGSLIGDWHYLDDPDYRTYRKSLDLWKDAGMNPIAAAWYHPNNIHGFDVQAGLQGDGTLQTTWAGYESNEDAMLDAMPQFTAMILAADYAWSGRNDEANEVGYDPALVFRRLYFGHPSPLTSQPGLDVVGSGLGFEVGPIHYGSRLNFTIASSLAPDKASASRLELKLAGQGTELAIAMQTVASADDGDPVADLVVELANGSKITKRLIYGRHLRSASDPAPLSISDEENGVASLRISLGKSPAVVKSISLVPLNSYTGLRVLGIELID
jgi:hypothetical protein